MKTIPFLTSILIAILAGLLFVPALQGSAPALSALIIALAVITAMLVAISAKETPSLPAPSTPPPPAAPAPSVAPPPPAAPAAATAEAEILAFLGLFQEKGRLLDFLMDDITSYGDDQVGAAARVVHQGCREVLREYFEITPVCPAEEGGTVTVPVGEEAADYRLVGRISGEPPFTGTLVHKGWKTTSVKLPRVVPSGRLAAITPAEVELK
jgi:Uncharacterized protein conserved in bacteria